jgi:hypothetical protein
MEETKMETSENDSASLNHNLNTQQQQKGASEKQTLKIEEVFTSSTRRTGKIVFH